MDIVVKGRGLAISDSFRTHIEDKISKAEKLSPDAQAVEVNITHEDSVRRPDEAFRVEITVFSKGAVLLAEAHASDKYAALDLAWAKLLERLRRARDRRKISRKGGHRRQSTGEAFAEMPVVDAPAAPAAAEDGEPAVEEDGDAEEADPTNGRIQAEGDSPVLLREKTFPAEPIGIEEALNRMEMVGHDFYLFIDEETSQPSVVYRRRGWSYGVIALDDSKNS